MANGVHAAVNPVQPPPPQPPLDRVLAKAERNELAAADDAVLPPRKLRDRRIEGVLRILPAHYAGK